MERQAKRVERQEVWAYLVAGKVVPAVKVGEVKRGQSKGAPRVLIQVLERNGAGRWGFRTTLVTAISCYPREARGRKRITTRGAWKRCP